MDDLGITVQADWLRLLAAAGYPVLTGPAGSFAVRTGLGSNTENGAVLAPTALHDAGTLDALLAHATGDGAPASAVLTSHAGPGHVEGLTARRWRPERNAHEMVGPLTVPGHATPDGVRVTEVLDDDLLAVHVDVFSAEDWYEDERDGFLELARAVPYGPGRSVRRWLALEDDRPVGAAVSALVAGTGVVSLNALCVAADRRRRGIGTALTRARLVAAAADGATTVHLSPSPDGAGLHGSLGLVARPSPPDRWFYSPADA